MAGGDGMSGTGTWTVPSPSVVGAGDSGAAGVVSGALGDTVTSTDVVTDVVSVVDEVVVPSPPESSPQATNSDASAAPEANANRVGRAR